MTKINQLFDNMMENESRKKLDSKTRPFAGLIGCHEEKREAYTRLYKRQVMSL